MDGEPRSSTIVTNGIALNVAEAGPDDGPPVLLLHGFPEFWYGWRHQLDPLADVGYHVLAPDQRGYNTSAKPDRIADHGLDALSADVVGLIDATGHEQAALIGHDWGGVVAWWTALRHPDRVRRLVVLNAPHPAAYFGYLRSHPGQLLKSWYVFFFQIPGLPEANFRLGDWRALVRALRRTSRPGTFTEADFARYRQAWSQPKAIRSMIHWYRASLRARPPIPPDPRIRVPTLIIWGARDRFIERGLATASLAFCDAGRLDVIEEATHWVQHEEPERVNRLLLDALSDPNPPTGSAES